MFLIFVNRNMLPPRKLGILLDRVTFLGDLFGGELWREEVVGNGDSFVFVEEDSCSKL